MITTPEQLRKQVSRGGNPYSLGFDGADDYVDSNYNVDLDSFSVSVWVKNANAFGNKQAVTDKWGDWRVVGEDGTGEPWLDSGGLEFAVTNGDGDRIGCGWETTQTGSWVHIVATYDSSTYDMKLYADNDLKDTNNTGGGRDYNDETVLVGVKNGLIGYFEGLIDDARIYNRALSADEIFKLYKGVLISQVGLVGYWPMDSGEGAIAYDKSGNGNDGDIIGATWSEDTPL